MPLTYTVFRTENLDGGQVRIYQGYEISGVGVILNVLVKMTIAGKEVRVLDEEVFVPGATASQFSGMTWTTEDTRTLDLGQKRYVRSFVPGGSVKLIELYRTVKQNAPGAFEIVAQEQLYLTQTPISAPAPVSITGSVAYAAMASWQSILEYNGGPALNLSFTLPRMQHIFANAVLSSYNSVGTNINADMRLLVDGNEVAWGRARYNLAGDDSYNGLTGTYRNASAGAHNITAQIYVYSGEVTLHHGTHRGKLEAICFG